MKIKAAVLYERNSPMKVEKVTLDEPQGEEVLVKLVATGVCHSDLHVITGDLPQPMPVVLGHEGAGIVERVGPGATKFQPGDHVVLLAMPSCGKCFYCLINQPSMCMLALAALGGATLPGGVRRLSKDDQQLGHFFGQASFAEYAVVHESTAVKIREDAPLEAVCLFGCGVVTGVGGVLNAAGIRAGESIVIYGCGGVGLSAIMGAKLAGAGRIIAVDMLDQKLEKARELGADYVVNAKDEDPVQRIYQITGQGADYAIECIGNVDVISQAFGSIRFGGKCVVLGLAPSGSTLGIDPTSFLLGKTITGCSIGSINPPIDLPRYVDLFMTGKLPIDKLITRSYSLDQINDAFEALEKGEIIRSVIRF